MRVPLARLLPSLFIGLTLAGCFTDPTEPPAEVPVVGSWLATDEGIRLSIDITGTEPDLTGDWQFTSLGDGGCEGTSDVQRLESSMAVHMTTGASCDITFQGSIIDRNTVKGILTGTMTNAGTDSALSGTVVVELHRQ